MHLIRKYFRLLLYSQYLYYTYTSGSQVLYYNNVNRLSLSCIGSSFGGAFTSELRKMCKNLSNDQMSTRERCLLVSGGGSA